MPESDLAYRSTTFPSPAMVPAEYAEKAMGSLMQLHSEVMEEKERRVDLYRRLMDREQAVAELRIYVRILEDRLGIKEPSPPPGPPAVTTEKENAATSPRQPANPPDLPRRPPSAIPSSKNMHLGLAGNNYRVPPRKEVMSGWKVW